MPSHPSCPRAITTGIAAHTCMRASVQVPCRSRSLRGNKHYICCRSLQHSAFSQEIHKRQIVMQSARWNDEPQYSDDASQHPDDGLLTGSSCKLPRRASPRGDRDDKPPQCTLADDRTHSRQNLFRTTWRPQNEVPSRVPSLFRASHKNTQARLTIFACLSLRKSGVQASPVTCFFSNFENAFQTKQREKAPGLFSRGEITMF